MPVAISGDEAIFRDPDYFSNPERTSSCLHFAAVLPISVHELIVFKSKTYVTDC